MKKKILSLALALAMCLALAVPAFAAGGTTVTSAPGEPVNITFDGYLRTEYIDAGDEDSFYAVYVVKDGSAVYVDSNEYTFQYGVLSNTYGYSPEMGVFWVDSGPLSLGGEMSRITLTADPNETAEYGVLYMILIPGFGENSYCWICESDFAKIAPKHKGVPGPDSEIYGTVGPDVKEQPAADLAYASTQNVLVDGRAVEFEMYALKDANGNDTNYVKLRDLALVLSGTPAQFEVGWNGAVNLETGKPYTSSGTEMSTPFSGNRSYQMAEAVTNINGEAADLTAFVLTDDAGNGYTYYQLRDLGAALGFNVGWSAESGVFVETDKPYAG